VDADEGDTIEVDGATMGTGYWTGAVSPGKHTVRVTAPGRKTWVRDVTLKSAENKNLAVTLAADKSAAPVAVVRTPEVRPAEAHISVDAEASSVIEIDGKSVGTGYFMGPVPVGKHTVRVTSPGFKPWERDVSVQADETKNLAVTLEKDVSPSKGVPAAVATAAANPATPSSSIFAKGPPMWMWIGGAAAIVGGGVASYFLLKSSDPHTTPGTFGPGTVNLP
jgi:hypothetical protein